MTNSAAEDSAAHGTDQQRRRVLRCLLGGVGGLSFFGSTGKVSGAASVPVPAWRQAMAVNTRIDLALNTQASIAPENNASLNPNHPRSAPWRGVSGWGMGYGGMNYAPDLGTYGSIIGTLGGHNGYWGNEVARLDLDTRLFSCLSDPYSSTSHPGSFHRHPDQGFQHADNVNGRAVHQRELQYRPDAAGDLSSLQYEHRYTRLCGSCWRRS